MSEWFCRVAGALSGPFSLDELEYLRDRGQLSVSDEVRCEGNSPWIPASDVPGLFPQSIAKPIAAVSVTPVAPPAVGSPAPALQPAQTASPPSVPLALPTEADRRRKQVLMGAGIGIGTAIIIFLLLLLLLTWGGGGNGFAGGGGGTGNGQGSGSGDGVGPGQGTGMGGGSGGGIGNSSGGSGNQAQGTGGGTGDQAPGGPTEDGTTSATGDEGTKSMGDGEDPDAKPLPNTFTIQKVKPTPGGGASKTQGEGGGGMFGGGGGGGTDGKDFFGVKVKGKIALVCDVSGSMGTDFPILVRELRKKFPKDTPLIIVNGCHFAPPTPGGQPPQKLMGPMPYMGNEFANDPNAYTANNTTDAIIFAVEELRRNTVMFNNDLQDSGSESAIDAFEELWKEKKFTLSGRSLNCDAPPRLLEFIKKSKGEFKLDPLTRTKSPAQAWSP